MLAESWTREDVLAQVGIHLVLRGVRVIPDTSRGLAQRLNHFTKLFWRQSAYRHLPIEGVQLTVFARYLAL